jgi:hypothetical protein
MTQVARPDSQSLVSINRNEVGDSSASHQEEVSSASLEDLRGMTNDELLKRVKSGFQKIAAELPYILELRSRFARLKRGNANIGGCKTWKEFCVKHLHRTDRRIRQVVAANSLVDRGKRLGLPANKKRTEAGTTPPAASSNWDAEETSRKCFAYVVNALEHLSVSEANRVLLDLIEKLQDERRMRVDPAPVNSKKVRPRKGSA